MISLNNRNCWFSSDFHFGHGNILKYDNRPFDTIQKHDAILLNTLQTLITPGDVFFFLGDFALAPLAYMDWLISNIPGEKFFIRGNHDKKATIKLYNKYGTYLGEQCKIAINSQKIILNHYAMLTWDEAHRGSWQLHGHSHGDLKYPYQHKQLDVSINIWNYKPIKFNEIKKIMDKIPSNFIHHER